MRKEPATRKLKGRMRQEVEGVEQVARGKRFSKGGRGGGEN